MRQYTEYANYTNVRTISNPQRWWLSDADGIIYVCTFFMKVTKGDAQRINHTCAMDWRFSRWKNEKHILTNAPPMREQKPNQTHSQTNNNNNKHKRTATNRSKEEGGLYADKMLYYKLKWRGGVTLFLLLLPFSFLLLLLLRLVCFFAFSFHSLYSELSVMFSFFVYFTSFALWLIALQRVFVRRCNSGGESNIYLSDWFRLKICIYVYVRVSVCVSLWMVDEVVLVNAHYWFHQFECQSGFELVWIYFVFAEVFDV